MKPKKLSLQVADVLVKWGKQFAPWGVNGISFHCEQLNTCV